MRMTVSLRYTLHHFAAGQSRDGCDGVIRSGLQFQCNGQDWVTPVDTSAQSGPIGECSSWNPL
jgi:hypothetical protein